MFSIGTVGEVYLLDEEPPKVAQGLANLEIVAPPAAPLKSEFLLVFTCKGCADLAISYDGCTHPRIADRQASIQSKSSPALTDDILIGLSPVPDQPQQRRRLRSKILNLRPLMVYREVL